MAFKLASAFVSIGARTAGLKSGLASAKNMIGGAMRGIGGLAAKASALAGGIGIGAAIKLAADAEELGSMFKAVFQEGSADAEKFAQDLAVKLGRSTGDVMEQMAGFQDLFVPMGFARSEAAKLSKQMTSLVQDVASFKNQNPADVARDFNSALVGNHETVRKFGIVITQAALDQELMNMGIAKGTKAATEQQKVMARLQMIIKGTTDAHGDAAKTAGSFTNRMRGLIGVIKDLMGTIGGIFLPVLADLAGKLTAWLRRMEPKIKDFADRMRAITEIIASDWDRTWRFIKQTTEVGVRFLIEAMAHARRQGIRAFLRQPIVEFEDAMSDHLKLQIKTLETTAFLFAKEAKRFRKATTELKQEAASDVLGDRLNNIIAKTKLSLPAVEGVKKAMGDAFGSSLRGMFAIQDANARLQDTLLKKQDPQDKMVNLLGEGNEIQRNILAAVSEDRPGSPQGLVATT